MRVIIEFLFLVVFIVVARAIISSLMTGVRSASTGAPRQTTGGPREAPPLRGTDLHKDPVCGTYVTEATRFQSQSGGQRFYYCSESCREKHALMTKASA
jgi:YHS domain-containing protein